MCAEGVGDGLGVLCAEQRGIVAQEGVEFLAGEGQERREEGFEGVDGAEGGVDRFGRLGFVGFDGAPGRGHVEVFVHLGGEAEGFLQGRAEFDRVDQVADGLETRVNGGEQFFIAGAQGAGFGDVAFPMFVAKRQDTVRQVAPGSDQFVIVTGDELFPVPVGIPVFGHVDGQVVAQGIGVIPREGIETVHDPVATAGNFAPFQVHKLVRGDIVGQGQRLVAFACEHFEKLCARAEQLGGPPCGVKEDVVFADEVKGFGVGIRPPIFPRVRLTGDLCPLDGGGQVADHRLEPDVKAFARPPFDGHGDAPIEVAGDRARFQPFGFDLAERLAEDGFAHVGFAGAEEFGNLGFQFGQVEEVVFGVAEFGGGVVHFGAGVEEFVRFEDVAAVVALIGACAFGPTDVAGSFDVPVGEETARAGGVPLRAGFGVQVAVFLEGEEDALGDFEMVIGMGGGKEVVGDPQLLKDIEEGLVVVLVDFFDGFAFRVGAEGDGGAVRVGAGDDEDAVPFQTVVARDDVPRQVGAGDVPNVDFGVGIRPGDGDEDIFGHGITP